MESEAGYVLGAESQGFSEEMNVGETEQEIKDNAVFLSSWIGG